MRIPLRLYGRLIAVLLLLVTCASAEPVTFRRAIELALRHSGTMAIALAEQTRTRQNYLSAQYNYTPAVFFGSGLGYSLGIPLSIVGTPPSIFNVTTQQALLNFSLRQSINAAKVEWKATDFDLLDKKNSVILDTALVYAELDSLTSKLKILREAQVASQRSQFISAERLKEGIDSELDFKKAKLATARIQLHLAQAEGQADVLRERLSKLTGIPANSLETVAESVPTTPDILQDDPAVPSEAAENDPNVRLAFEKAKAADLRAQAEHKQMLPSVELGSQYALLSTFNNYQTFYTKFVRNNYTIGLNLRVPFLNFSQRAVAQAADADAIKAKKQAENVRNDVEMETLKLQRSLRQLAAARDVAKLEYEVAQADIDATQGKVASGEANARDEEHARLVANDNYALYLDANFDLYKAQVQLLRSTGKLQEWALGK